MALPNHKELESRNPGYGGSVIGEVTQFQGKTRSYNVITNRSNGVPFTEIPHYADVIDEVIDNYSKVFPNRDRLRSIDRLRKSLSHPRTILERVQYEGVTVGHGVFPRLIIDGESVVYSSRAIQREHQGEGVGSHILERAVVLHFETVIKGHRPLNWLVFMTHNPVSYLTARRLPFVKVGYPLGGHRYSENPKAKSMMLGVHRGVFINSESINTNTGVSKRELWEIGMNETFRPDPQHKELWAYYQEMISPPPAGVDANREAGDEIYCTFLLDQDALVAALEAMRVSTK